MKKILFLIFLLGKIPSALGNDLDALYQTSCPEGGVKVRKYVCCKDGYAAELKRDKNNNLYFGEYTRVNGECGCPNGGKQSPQNPVACCKDGFKYVNYQKDYTEINFKDCGHPSEGYKPKGDRESWCKDGYMYSETDKSYSSLKPDECGCPEGNTYHAGKEHTGGYCCKDGYELHTKGVYRINSEICDCPEGTKKTKYDSICCLINKQGYAIENENQWEPAIEKLDFLFCGCPENGEMVNIGLPLYVCCKDGYVLDEKTGLYSEKAPYCQPKKTGKILKRLLKSL